MTPYYFVFFALLGLNGVSRARSGIQLGSAVVIGTVLLWILLAFRAPTVGTDVPSYILALHLARNLDVLSGERLFNFEPGFSAYLHWLANLGVEDQAFLAVTAALTLIPVAVTVARYSKMPLLSLFLYATLGFYAFAFSGVRQAWAVALCFLAIGSIRERKLVRFLTIVGLASLLHLSALVFLPAYWIYRIRPHRLDVVVGLIGLTLVWLLRTPIYDGLYRLYRNSDAVVDSTGAISFFLALILAWLGAIALHPSTDRPDPDDQMLTATRNFLYVAALFQALASVSFLVGRVGQYYLIFVILLVPHLIERQRDRGAKFFLLATVVVISTAFFQLNAGSFNIVPHSFAQGG